MKKAGSKTLNFRKKLIKEPKTSRRKILLAWEKVKNEETLYVHCLMYLLGNSKKFVKIL